MKKIYILMVACAMMFVGCQKDFDGILTAEIENYHNNDSKVYINNGKFACWEDGDGLDLYVNTNTTNPYKIAINGDEAVLVNNFNNKNLNLDIDNIIEAIYPTGNLCIESTQKYNISTSSNYQKLTAPMIAKTKIVSGSNNLVFKNVASLLEFRISTAESAQDIKITKIVLRDKNQQRIAGNLDYSPKNNSDFVDVNAIDFATNDDNVLKTISMEINQPITTSESLFYIYVAPISRQYEFTVTYMKGNEEKSITGSMSEVHKFESSKLYSIPIVLPVTPSAE